MTREHATREHIAALGGECPSGIGVEFDLNAACGANAAGIPAWTWRDQRKRNERCEPKEVVTCAACIALYPDETRVRMDQVEQASTSSPCCGVEGIRNTAANTDGWNHRALPTDTHVCPACGKGWRYL